MTAHQYYKKRIQDDCGLLAVCSIALAAIMYTMTSLGSVVML